MENLNARAVFFVRDAQRALDYYTRTLGFSTDWIYEEGGRPFVFQVSLFGFQLILNQAESGTETRPGHGRVFIGLEDHQWEPFKQHLDGRNIQAKPIRWGAPALLISDLDENELFIWPPQAERDRMEQGDS